MAVEVLRDVLKQRADGVVKRNREPDGIDLIGDADVREVVIAEHSDAVQIPEPVVVPDEEFLTEQEALDRLEAARPSLPRPTGLYHFAAGKLHRAYRASDGVRGVTSASVEREAQWRRDASWWELARRGLANLVFWV